MGSSVYQDPTKAGRVYFGRTVCDDIGRACKECPFYSSYVCYNRVNDNVYIEAAMAYSEWKANGTEIPEHLIRYITSEERKKRQYGTRYSFNGEMVSISMLSERHGVTPTTLYRRIVTLGWPIEKAVSEPIDTRKNSRGKQNKEKE